MSGTSLALKIGSLVIGLGIFMVIAKQLKGLKRFGIAGLVYTVLTSILMAVPALFLFFDLGISEALLLVLSQLYLVILGILHVNLAKNTIEWYPTRKFKMQIVFIIGFLVFGFFLSNICFSFLKSPDLPILWYLSLLWFLVPVILNEAINILAGIPEKQYTPWYYPIDQSIEDPSDAELDNPIVISFVFQKNILTKELATFRAKAPVGMALGRLFYFFINDYNSRHPEEPISYTNDSNDPDAWVFFKLKNKLFRLKEALDQDSSISTNNIRENDVLICKRIENILEINNNEATK